jgi:beta-lactamase regulating signal transducer with metallopeptidase domain
MSYLVEEWADRILSASLQGGLALLGALLLCRLLVKASPLVKVWMLRVALLKLMVSLFVVSGFAVFVLSESQAAGKAGPSFFATVTGTILPFAMVLWLLSVVIGVVRHVRNRRTVTALVHEAVIVSSPEILDLYHEACEQTGVTNAPKLLCHPAIASPILIQNSETSMILPEQLLEGDARQIKTAMAHELAHHRHRDLTWGWLIAAADLLFFFHPLALVALKKLRLYEECAADALAMHATGSSPSAYSRILLSFAETGVALPGAYGMADTAKELDRRIKALYAGSGQVRIRTKILLAGLVAVASSLLVPWTIASEQAASVADASPRMGRATTAPPGSARGPVFRAAR